MHLTGKTCGVYRKGLWWSSKTLPPAGDPQTLYLSNDDQNKTNHHRKGLAGSKLI
jgi:hypothetical protein